MKPGEMHPEIISLIHKRDEIHSQLYISNNPIAAIDGIYGLLSELEPKDKDPKFLEELRKELRILTENRSRVEIRRRVENNLFTYRDWLGRLNELLWEKSYLTNQKYSGEIGAEDLEGAEEQE